MSFQPDGVKGNPIGDSLQLTRSEQLKQRQGQRRFKWARSMDRDRCHLSLGCFVRQLSNEVRGTYLGGGQYAREFSEHETLRRSRGIPRLASLARDDKEKCGSFTRMKNGVILWCRRPACTSFMAVESCGRDGRTTNSSQTVDPENCGAGVPPQGGRRIGARGRLINPADVLSS